MNTQDAKTRVERRVVGSVRFSPVEFFLNDPYSVTINLTDLGYCWLFGYSDSDKESQLIDDDIEVEDLRDIREAGLVPVIVEKDGAQLHRIIIEFDESALDNRAKELER